MKKIYIFENITAILLKQTKQKAMIQRVIFGLLALFSFYYFHSWASLRIFNMAPVITSLIAALVVTFFLTQAIFKFKSFEDLLNKDKKNEYAKFVWLMLMPLALGTWLILINNARRLNNDLPYYGESVAASIIQIDEGHINNRGKKIYMVTTVYTPLNAPVQTHNMEVDFDIKKKIKDGYAFNVLYAPFDPKICKLVVDSSVEAIPRSIKTIEAMYKKTKMDSIEPEFLKFWMEFRKVLLNGKKSELLRYVNFPLKIASKDTILIGEEKLMEVREIYLNDETITYNAFDGKGRDSVSNREIIDFFAKPEYYNEFIRSSREGLRNANGLWFEQRDGEWKLITIWFWKSQWDKLTK